MARDFARSKKTNAIYDKIAKQLHLGFSISVPGCGQIRLREEAMLELIWIMRSSDAEDHFEKWVDRIRTTLEDAKASLKASQEEARVEAN